MKAVQATEQYFSVVVFVMFLGCDHSVDLLSYRVVDF